MIHFLDGSFSPFPAPSYYFCFGGCGGDEKTKSKYSPLSISERIRRSSQFFSTTCVTQWVDIQDGIGGSFAHMTKFKQLASSLWWNIKLFWKIVFNLGIHATIVAKNTYSVPLLCRVWLKLGRHGLFWFRPIIGCTLYLKLFAQISLVTTALLGWKCDYLWQNGVVPLRVRCEMKQAGREFEWIWFHFMVPLWQSDTFLTRVKWGMLTNRIKPRRRVHATT